MRKLNFEYIYTDGSENLSECAVYLEPSQVLKIVKQDMLKQDILKKYKAKQDVIYNANGWLYPSKNSLIITNFKIFKEIEVVTQVGTKIPSSFGNFELVFIDTDEESIRKAFSHNGEMFGYYSYIIDPYYAVRSGYTFKLNGIYLEYNANGRKLVDTEDGNNTRAWVFQLDNCVLKSKTNIHFK